MVFVEVKTRSSTEYGPPEKSVNRNKQFNIRRAISHYVKYYRVERPYRFDVISIVGTLDDVPEINHIEDFALSMR